MTYRTCQRLNEHLVYAAGSNEATACEQRHITFVMSGACCSGMWEVPDNSADGAGRLSLGHDDSPSLGDNVNQRPALRQGWICALGLDVNQWQEKRRLQQAGAHMCVGVSSSREFKQKWSKDAEHQRGIRMRHITCVRERELMDGYKNRKWKKILIKRIPFLHVQYKDKLDSPWAHGRASFLSTP